MERSKRSLTVRLKHEDDNGMNEDSNFSHSVRASNKEDSQRTTTLTDNKKKTTKRKDLQCMKTHAFGINYALMFPSVSSHFTHCWVSLCTSCRQFNCCRCNHFTKFLTCTRIPCIDSHCENGSFEVLSLHVMTSG